MSQLGDTLKHLTDVKEKSIWRDKTSGFKSFLQTSMCLQWKIIKIVI